MDVRDYTDWADIAFHYVLDSKGYVYEARQPRAVPSAVLGYVNSEHTLILHKLCITKIKYCTKNFSSLQRLLRTSSANSQI